jgi:hypothetical protein
MFSFCPHCGQTLEQNQAEGQTLVCRHCRKTIGTVASPRKEIIDTTDELIRGGTAARCPSCEQVVETKTAVSGRSFVPHFTKSETRKMCPGSGKPVTTEHPAPIQRPPTSKDLSAFITRDFIKVVSCQSKGDIRIEELTLEYLDKADRIRLQIDALRDILGQQFRMKPYPPKLNRPHLAVWGNAGACVVARKHDHGGYQQIAEAEIQQVVNDVRENVQLFLQ